MLKKPKCKICVALRSYLPSSVIDASINQSHFNDGHVFSVKSSKKLSPDTKELVEELFDRLDEVV